MSGGARAAAVVESPSDGSARFEEFGERDRAQYERSHLPAFMRKGNAAITIAWMMNSHYSTPPISVTP